MKNSSKEAVPSPHRAKHVETEESRSARHRVRLPSHTRFQDAPSEATELPCTD